MLPERDEILGALENVIDPELHKPVTELDMVRDLVVREGGHVEVTVALTVAGCPMRSSFEDQVQRFVGAVEGVSSVELHFDVMTAEEKAALSTRLRGGRPEKTISLSPTTRVLAIASGKGGVGKSTLTANVAAALAARGERVGVLDADVYGHSIPHMLGVHQRPVVVDTMIVPPVRGDLKLMSIGFFLDDNAPVMWRGPMLHRALEQFLSDVYWGELDTLVVDMPPGTGDVAISLGQLLPRAEVLIVTTRSRPRNRSLCVRPEWQRRWASASWVSPRTCRISSAPGRRSSGRAAAGGSPTRSGCRFSAASRWIRPCARLPTPGRRFSRPRPRQRRQRRSWRSPTGFSEPVAARSASRSPFSRSPERGGRPSAPSPNGPR